MRWWFVNILHYVCILTGVNGVKITHLRVPAAIRNGTGQAALLDCDYSLEEEDSTPDAGLVIKWYFDNDPVPVYQWIIGKKPQGLGILKGRLNLNHRVSDHNYTMHRALYIVNPTTELSGEYKCFVSSFNDEDSQSKTMLVYAVTEKKFTLSASVPRGLNYLAITCIAEMVFPEPVLELYRDVGGQSLDDSTGMQLVHWASFEKSTRHGSYNILGKAMLTEAEFNKPIEFICKLNLPAVKYRTTRSDVFYPRCGSKANQPPVNTKQALIVMPLLSATLINTYCRG